MIISTYSLGKFIDISHIDIKDIAKCLNNIGLEVEALSQILIPKKVVIGKVISKAQHPNADKLSVCQVEVGDKQVLQIVCGAKNVEADQYVAVALIGAILPYGKGGDLEIKASVLRDVASNGMLCSSTELGLPKINDGIMILDNSVNDNKPLVLGEEVSKLPLFNAYNIEISITPNRGDCLSALGVARELSAAFNLRIKNPIQSEDIASLNALGIGKVLHIQVEDKINADLLYKMIDIVELKVSLEVAIILANNDALKEDCVKNYLEYATFMSGVVLNAYKLNDCKDMPNSKSGEKIINIKKQKDGFIAIDGKEPLSLLGVISYIKDIGIKPGILLLEASYIEPTSISSLLYQSKVTKDASITYKSTRGSNPDLEYGINLLCQNITAHNKASVYQGTHSISKNYEEKIIKSNFEAINKAMGANLSNEEIVQILQRLNFSLKTEKNIFYTSVPRYRHDIQTSQDIAEEVLRIYGIDKITSAPLRFAQQLQINTEYVIYKNTRAIAKRACVLGYNECMHYVFGSKQDQEKLGFVNIKDSLDLSNPITNELNTLRTSMIPYMLKMVEKNINLGFKSIKFFEIGSVYDENRIEKSRICFVANGVQKLDGYPYPKPIAYDALSFSDEISQILGDITLENGIDATFMKGFGYKNTNLLHPFVSAIIIQNNQKIGYIAKIHPTYSTEDTFICEVDINLSSSSLNVAKEVSKYQKSTRDLTIMIDKNIEFSNIRKEIKAHDIAYVVGIYPLDIYVDSSFIDKMALSLRVVLQSHEKTLEMADMESSISKIMDILSKKFDATLR